MSSLPQYPQNDPGRFDFRVPDNLGGYLYPDWDDPDLKVEFRDSGGVLQFTATVSSDPALTQGEDDEGYYVTVEGLDLTEFALGNVEAGIYCRWSGEEVQPYPTILVAFEVIAAAIPDQVIVKTFGVRVGRQAIVRGDTPTFCFSVKDQDGAAADLSDYGVWLAVKEHLGDAAYLFERQGVITNAGQGQCEVSLTAEDTATAGQYYAEVELIGTGNKAGQVHTAARFSLAILGDVRD